MRDLLHHQRNKKTFGARYLALFPKSETDSGSSKSGPEQIKCEVSQADLIKALASSKSDSDSDSDQDPGVLKVRFSLGVDSGH